MHIRRIRLSDRSKLKELCENDSRWRKYFGERHDSWVARALLEAFGERSRGDWRVVFGAFETRQGQGDAGDSQLVGCLFVKKSLFENAVELKNCILPSRAIELDQLSLVIAERLIERAALFSEVRGVDKIEVELPQEEHGLIAVFLRLRFRVVSLRERYGARTPVCTLERLVGDTYHGDPFDWVKFGRWFLRSFVPCKVTKEERVEDLARISFEILSPSRAFPQEEGLPRFRPLFGFLWILERDDCGENASDNLARVLNLHKQSPVLTIVLAFRLEEKQKTELTAVGIIVFEGQEVKRIAGGSKSSLAIPISYDAVGGVITVLEREQFLEYAAKPSLTYYLLSGLHAGISVAEDDEPPVVLGVFCPNWKENTSGIIGFAKIRGIERMLFTELLSRELPSDSALTKEDLSLYCTYSEGERVALLSCGPLVEFLKPLSLDDDWIADAKMREYLKSELVQNASNTAYLDWDSAGALIRQGTKATDGFAAPASGSGSQKGNSFPAAVTNYYQVEKIQMSTHQIHVGGNAIINIDSILDQVQQSLSQGNALPVEKKNELAELVAAFRKDLEVIKGTHVQETTLLAQRLQEIVQGASQSEANRNRGLLQLSGKGLVEAAETVVKVMPSLVTTAGVIAKFVAGL